MLQLENPYPKFVEMTEAATKLLSYEADLFLLNQELRAISQLKRIAAIVIGFIFLNLTLTLAAVCFAFGLHENGWSAYTLALVFFFFFILFAAMTFALAFRVNPSHSRPIQNTAPTVIK